MLLEDLLDYLRSIAPENLAMDGDPIGLLIEPLRKEIKSVAVCLDATELVCKKAIEVNAELIIAHHPLIYNPLKKLESSNPIAAVAMNLVRHGIGLFAMHTNWDIAPMGVNDTLAGKIGLTDVKPLPGAEIARIGKLPSPLSPQELLNMVDKSLDCQRTCTLRHGPLTGIRSTLSSIAVCGGAGASLMPHVIASGADAYLTSDVRHDQFIDAAGRGIFLIDAGHEATEAPGMVTLADTLSRRYPDLNVIFYENWN